MIKKTKVWIVNVAVPGDSIVEKKGTEENHKIQWSANTSWTRKQR